MLILFWICLGLDVIPYPDRWSKCSLEERLLSFANLDAKEASGFLFGHETSVRVVNAN